MSNFVQASPVASYSIFGGGGTIPGLPSNVTLGNLLVLALSYDISDGITTFGITDNLGNTYTLLGTFSNGTLIGTKVFAAPVTFAGACVPTVALNGLGRGCAAVAEYTGMNNASIFDQSANGFASTAAITTAPTAATDTATEVLFAVCTSGGAGAWTAGGSFTSRTDGSWDSIGGDLMLMDRNVSATGAYTASATAATATQNMVSLFTLRVIPPVHTISGNVGVAGATVTLSGAASASTTADGSGNYSFPNLLDGTYFVTPSDSGTHFFMPNAMKRILSGANATLCNFGAVIPAHPYAELAYDSFQQPDGALNGTNWTQGTGFNALQTHSNACIATTDTDCMEEWTNAVWTNLGQYVQFTLAAFATDSAFLLLYQILDESLGYYVFLTLNAGKIDMQLFSNNTPILDVTVSTNFAPGDVLRIDKAGTLVKMY